jgi:RNA polymerase sigma-70 factor (ECF subfamily)
VDNGSRLRTLFLANYAALGRYARHRGLNAEEADDLIASTFEVVWRRLDSVPNDDEAVLWLYGIAFNQLRNLRRAKRRQIRLASRISPMTTTSESPDPGEIPIAAIKAALASLDDDDREVIMLVAAEGLSAIEVGVVLGCGESAVRSRLHRARKRLAKRLAESSSVQRSASPGHVLNERGDVSEVEK